MQQSEQWKRGNSLRGNGVCVGVRVCIHVCVRCCVERGWWCNYALLVMAELPSWLVTSQSINVQQWLALDFIFFLFSDRQLQSRSRISLARKQWCSSSHILRPNSGLSPSISWLLTQASGKGHMWMMTGTTLFIHQSLLVSTPVSLPQVWSNYFVTTWPWHWLWACYNNATYE